MWFMGPLAPSHHSGRAVYTTCNIYLALSAQLLAGLDALLVGV